MGSAASDASFPESWDYTVASRTIWRRLVNPSDGSDDNNSDGGKEDDGKATCVWSSGGVTFVWKADVVARWRDAVSDGKNSAARAGRASAVHSFLQQQKHQFITQHFRSYSGLIDAGSLIT